jgi:hypothetical protein
LRLSAKQPCSSDNLDALLYFAAYFEELAAEAEELKQIQRPK